MTNLFALCRPNGGALEVKRVRLTHPVQAKIDGLFQAQTSAFLDGVDEEIDFAGDWKPDSDEIFVIDAPAEASVITTAIAANPTSLPDIDGANFQNENIKGLFVVAQNAGIPRVSIQLFSANQILARRFSLWLDGNTFKELTDPAFTLDNYIHAIMENGKIKFKSFFNVKRIFELSQFYQEATDNQIDGFCAHSSLVIADVASFKAMADQQIRKMVHAITKTGVLDKYPVGDISQKAASLGLVIAIAGDKMVVPSDRKEAKRLFRFLDDGIYEAPLSSTRYMTNSKRPFS